MISKGFNDKSVHKQKRILGLGFLRNFFRVHSPVVISEENPDISLVEHPRLESEIPKLLCNSSRARKLLNWEPETTLSEGIDKLKEWTKCRINLANSQTAKPANDRLRNNKKL